MSCALLVLEYLKVFLSAPPMVAVTVIVLFCIFRLPITRLLGRIGSIRWGEAEASLLPSQVERAEVEAAASTKFPQPTDASPAVPAGFTLSAEQQEKLMEFIQAERARAALWEYRYLNLFLAPNTQKVLDWLAAHPQRTTLRLVNDFLVPLILDPEERAAIVEALTRHFLIRVEGELVSVSEKGREYLKWRGPYLTPPPPPPKLKG